MIARDLVAGVVDLPRLKAANSWTERVQAVDWPRATLLLVPLSVLAAGVLIVPELTAARAYPPPLPSNEEIETRRVLAQNPSPAPPPILTQRNKPVGAAL